MQVGQITFEKDYDFAGGNGCDGAAGEFVGR